MRKLCLLIILLLLPIITQAQIQSFKFWIENDSFKGKVVTLNNDRAYNIGLDADNNPNTGCGVCGFRGIDYEISFQYVNGIPVVLFCDFSNCSCSSSDPLNEQIEWGFEQYGKVFNFSIPLSTIYQGTYHINIYLNYLEKIEISGDMLEDDQIIDCDGLDIRCDYDRDYDVDGSDLIIFSNSFGKVCR